MDFWGVRFNHITVLILRIRTESLRKQWRLRSDTEERGVWSGFTLSVTHQAILHTFTGSKKDLLKRSIRKSVTNLSNLIKKSYKILSQRGARLNQRITCESAPITSRQLNQASWKHAYKILPPLAPVLLSKTWGLQGYELLRLFLLKNIDCGYSLKPPRMFWEYCEK